MNNVLIVANLKSYKTKIEAKEWLDAFVKIKETENSLNDKEIIICPPFQLLFMFGSYAKDKLLPIKIGAQNVSPFDEGAYTGEVNAKQIKDFADFVLIGHSERRNNFGETDDMLSKKTTLSLKYGLIPIFLVQGKDNLIPQGVEIIAYEPVFAIGSGNPDTPENADQVASFIKSENDTYKILYGGSVTSENVKNFTKMPNVDGVLVGGASLNPEEFIKIIYNA
ncbi:MAG: triose-phosphate isomerase [Patescibacteria group bacterium]|nr:triose-phosphate isomerase [Patescibacteria group bacterium]